MAFVVYVPIVLPCALKRVVILTEQTFLLFQCQLMFSYSLQNLFQIRIMLLLEFLQNCKTRSVSSVFEITGNFIF